MTSVASIVKCPHCGYVADRAGEMHDDGSSPKDGDVSLCIGCGGFSIFEAALHDGLRKPTLEEKLDIAADPECFKLHWAWQRLQAKRKAH